MHSQGNEEEFILQFFKDKPNGYFVEIGANDGEKGSNCYALFELGWRGLCVEADPVTYSELVKRYGHIEGMTLLHAAVWDREGLVPFYRHLDFCSGLSSIYNLQPNMAEPVDVTCVTLDTLLQNVSKVDFLSLDAEGCDMAILQAYSFRVRPMLIMVEPPFSGEEKLDSFMSDNGYHLVFVSSCQNRTYALS